MPLTPNSTGYLIMLTDIRSGGEKHYLFSSQAKSDSFVSTLQADLALLPEATHNNVAIFASPIVVDSNIGV